MTAVRTGRADPLAPVREALVARARDEAARLLGRAEADAADVVARAEREAAAIRHEARAQGASDAEAVLVAERAQARRRARAVVLAAQREVFEELRGRARQAATALRDDPGYPQMRERLAARARAALGQDAAVTEPAEGGVVADCLSRRVVYTLPALADDVLDTMGTDLEGLWSA